MRRVAECGIEGCDRVEVLRRGWCNRHYLRWRNYGDPVAPEVPERPNVLKVCPWCGSSFKVGTSRVVHCSKSCARKAEQAAGRLTVLTDANRRRMLDPSLPRDERQRRKGEEARRRRRARLANVEREPYTIAEIAERDGYVCWLCDRPVDMGLKYPHPESASVDHVIPLSHQGPDTPANVKLAHLGENIARGNRVDWKPNVAS